MYQAIPARPRRIMVPADLVGIRLGRHASAVAANKFKEAHSVGGQVAAFRRGKQRSSPRSG
jgi:hypothetical protein